jgi:hypothetical protein
MKKIFFILTFLLFFFFVNTTNAQTVWTSNSTGSEKNTFYTNETVYMTSSNISTTTNTTRIYITADNNSWINGAVLTDVRGGTYIEISTNSTGYFNHEAIWTTPVVGKYDVVVDVNRDGVYNDSIDYVDSLTTTGFEVLLAPFPTLSVSLGANTPANHNWNSTDVNENVMIQMKLTAGAFEGVTINSIGLIASGSGDDKKGISVIRLLLDSNNNGLYDSGDNLIGYSQAAPPYFKDNSFATITLTSGYTIPMNSSVNMLIAYTMSSSNSNGDTFGFQVASMTATGSPSGQSVTVSGSISSAVKTIVAPSATTTTTAETSTTSTTIQTATTTTESTTTTLPQEETKNNYLLIAIIISVAVAVGMVLFLFFRTRLSTQTYEYKFK